MKKEVIILLAILIMPTVISVVGIDMKIEHNSQEILISKISGNFVEPLTSENIFFYRGHVEIPMIYDLKKIQEIYYVSATLPEVELSTEYSLVIKDVQYMKGTQISDEEIKRDFTIINQTADFSIEPAVISTKKDFTIKVQNLQAKEIEIKIETELNLDSDDKITLNPGQSKDINFELGNFDEPILGAIKLSTDSLEYNVPIYVDKTQTPSNGEDNGGNGETPNDPKELDEPDPQAVQTCEEMGGTICQKDYVCVGRSVDAFDEKCCLGECKEIEEDTGWKIVGWVIIVGVLTLVIVFGKKLIKKK